MNKRLTHDLETQVSQSRLVKKLQAENNQLRARVSTLLSAIKHIGVTEGICVFNYTKEICEGCGCHRSPSLFKESK